MEKFAKLNEVEDKIDFMPVEVNWAEIEQGKPITAFTYYDEDKNCHVVVTPKLDCVYMHECGHIIYGHNSFSKEATNIAEEIFEQKLKNITKHILNRKQDEVRNSTIHFILNVAMDMEVNSKLFSLEEQERMGETISKAYQSYNRPVLPKDFGYDEGRNYIFYLLKMSQDAQLVRKLADIQINSEKYVKLAKQQNSSISEQEAMRIFRKMIEKAVDENKMPDGSSILRAGDKDVNNDLQQKFRSLLNLQPENDVISGKHFTSLEKAFTFLIPELKKNYVSDPLFYYNRRRYGKSGILISKRVERTSTILPTVYILVDCSLSMDKKLLNDIAETLKNVRLNKKSKVIFWDTKLCKEISFGEIKTLKEFPLGGGTSLAGGIRYINSLKKEKDSLIVISDFYDTLEFIKKALFEVKNSKHLMIGCGDPNPDLLKFKEFNTYIC